MAKISKANADCEELGGESVSDESGDDLDETTAESEQCGSEESEQETGSESGDDESSRPVVSLASGQLDPKEWIEFNKKVISMRPLYKSAKVQYINKLSRQIKVMRQKKGSPSEVEKHQRKADNRVQEIAYIKRLKTDIIPKFALLHSKDEITKIINSAESSMEYRVKAKVARMPVISRAAEAYHAENPDWRETLFKLIQLAGKKMKKKRRKLRGKDPKKKSAAEDPSQPKPGGIPKKVPRNSQCGDSGRFDASNFPEAPPGFEDSVRGNDNFSDDDSDGESESDQSLGESDIMGSYEASGVGRVLKEDHQGKRSGYSGEKQNEVAEVNRLKRPASNKKGPVGGNKKKRVTTENSEEFSDLESDQEEEDVTIKQKSNVDPFFMTSDNKEYKTIWKVEPADSFKNKNPKEPEFMFKNARSFEDFKNKKGDKRGPKAGFPNNKKVKESKGKTQSPALENLHPSWQAKKKLNVTTAAFQGKKIVFDDDA